MKGGMLLLALKNNEDIFGTNNVMRIFFYTIGELRGEEKKIGENKRGNKKVARILMRN
jgi:hypothetical protein